MSRKKTCWAWKVLPALALSCLISASALSAGVEFPGLRLNLPDLSSQGWTRLEPNSFYFRYYNAMPDIAWQKGESCVFLVSQNDPGFYLDDIIDLMLGTLGQRQGVEVQARSSYPINGWKGFYLRLAGPGESLGTCSRRADVTVVTEYWNTIYNGKVLQLVLSAETRDYASQPTFFGDYLRGIILQVPFSGAAAGGQGPAASGPAPVVETPNSFIPDISIPGLSKLVGITREKLGLSQVRLAELANVTKQDVRDLEEGKINVRIDVIDKITTALAAELNKKK